MDSVFLTADAVHDGDRVIPGAGLLLKGGQLASIGAAPPDVTVCNLGPGWLVPGFVDLQVNGGGGVMLGPETGTLQTIMAAHAGLGATTLLPTLITDTPGRTRGVIAAGAKASQAGLPGFAGLHLEGPHLDPRRAGAHDPALIRPMTADDLALYVQAARELPALMITLAPCAVLPGQIAALAAAGVVVSLGHSDATEGEARAALAEGARAVTHLWNAMSGLSHRAPGLVGATLDGDAVAGLIADGHHVSDAALRITLKARSSGLFLVSDAMAVAGSAMQGFDLGGRRIDRTAGRLRLADGTLAGADLSLPLAVARLVGLGCPPSRAVAMASSVPADLIGSAAGRLRPGGAADFLHLGADWMLRGVWQGGRPVTPAI